MFIAGGVQSTVLQLSLLQWWSMRKMLFGLQEDIPLQYHEWQKLEKLEVKLSGSGVFSSNNTFMF